MDSQPLSQIINNEDQICKMLRTHFLRLRKEQESDKTKERPLSEDIKFTFSLVEHNVSNPIQMLKTMGIIFLGKSIALNLSLFQTYVICCRSRTIQLLEEEKWIESGTKYKNQLVGLIGTNEIKNWSIFEYPPGSELEKYLKDHQNLIATEHSFGLDQSPEVFLIGPGLPPTDVLKEPHFPLVNIQYDRILDSFEVANFIPKNLTKKNLKYNLINFQSINIPYNNNRK